MEIKKILVPIDFSDYSKNSLKYAVAFASRFDAEIILVYVVEPIIYPADFSFGQIAIPAMDAELRSQGEQQLRKLIETEAGKNVTARAIVRSGKPFVEINQLAREENVDLIILASHGHTGIEHVFFGSTADKVVRKAPCPVLTLREKKGSPCE
ncbi:MAG: universal stress protein [Bacteroidota bacterium]|nr:universal stress protein [Bacteroidota bacterium]